MGTRLLLDAPSLVYRAFFALPTTITDSAGRPVNAVRGVLEMISRLLVDRSPGEIVTAFDNDWRPSFRVDSYPGYKSDRPEDPPELPAQFDVLADVLDAAGIKRAEAEGLEADDVLATLAERARDEDRIEIVTGDRDLVALIRDPQVALLFTMRGVSDLRHFDEATAEDEYGVPPRLYEQFAMLRGDPSDGLPGVAGIGPVRAAKLLGEFGSVDGILAAADSLPSGQREAFEESRGYLQAMRSVVPMVRDADVFTTDGGEPDEDALRELAEGHGLGASPVRLARALSRQQGRE